MMANMTMTLGEGEPAAGPWQVVPLAQFVRMLGPRDGAPSGRPWILAVDGRSGSGKTTLAERIWGAVPASTVVHTDDVAWSQAMFDWTDLLIGGVLEPVHRGEAVSFRPPAWRERNRAGAIEVPQGRELLIVEGAGAARHELMDLVDAVVWVQSDMAEAERRGIERDGGNAATVSLRCRRPGAWGGYGLALCAVRVCPAALSQLAGMAPIAVAGVRTPARSGKRSRSRARHSALSPSITEVAW